MTTRFAILYFFMALLISSCKKEDELPAEPKLLYATKGASAGIYDAEGRRRILRGVNYNVLGDYWQGNTAIPTTKAYSSDDMRMMATYGFNCVRLLFNWSKLEPQRGDYDEAYIAQIKTAIQDAAQYNMYVMLDMHQDAWGKYIATPPDSVCSFPAKGWDGAPEWATLTDNATTCTDNGRRESAPAVYHAFQHFWDNTDSIQDACIAAWAELVRATAAYENVLGYDLINEPSLGYLGDVDSEREKMGAFYGKLVQAIRSAESSSGIEHIIFFEPAIQFNGQDQLALAPDDFTADENIVFAPHAYFEAINTSFTIEQGFGILALGSENIFKTALFVGEWGFFGDPNNDVEKVKRFAKAEDRKFASSTWWQWAQAPGDPHGMSWDGTNYAATSLHLLEIDQSGNFTGNLNAIYLKVLSRTRPNAIAGVPAALTSNPDNGEIHFEATTTDNGVTELWIPALFGTPTISGSNIALVELKNVDGGYLAHIAVEGKYSIDVKF